jgi:hypothetical protein
MKEIPCSFGEHNHISGIITEPELPGQQALILISAGLIPFYGPFRLYVEIARQVATHNVTTLRFDLGGIGESSVYHDKCNTLQKRTEHELRSAVNLLTYTYPQLKSITLAGLCSGAEDAFRYAGYDSRITGVIMIDPFAYQIAYWQYYHQIYRIKRRLMRFIKLYQPIPRKTNPVVQYKYMEHSEANEILKSLMDRRVNLHFIYTGGMREKFNHPGQFKKMFPTINFEQYKIEDMLKIDFFPQIDHTPTEAVERKLIINAIIQHQINWQSNQHTNLNIEPSKV